VTATIMGDHPIALSKKNIIWHPVVGRQRPTVMKKQWFALAPVFEENLGAVLGGHCRMCLFPLRIRHYQWWNVM